MSIIEETYDIRFAKYDEIDEIMSFIDTYWKKGHILARNRSFFEYEMVIDGRVNFVIAKDRRTGKIAGLHGILQASRYTVNQDTWGVIWKVIPDAVAMLGFQIVKKVDSLTKTRAFLSIGANPDTTVPIMQYMRKYKAIGRMRHFYYLSKRAEYKIAIINHYEDFNTNIVPNVSITKCDNFEQFLSLFDENILINSLPYKDMWYINHRYFEHPIYNYNVYLIHENNQTKSSAAVICREDNYNDSKVLRIVDYLGPDYLFANLSEWLNLMANEYEYIDIYFYGFNDKYVMQSGMREVMDDDTNIIPNYFHPYLAQNIDIWVGSPIEGMRFFKADGDQDRPC